MPSCRNGTGHAPAGGSERIVDAEGGEGGEVAVVGPDFGGAVVEGRQRDLEVEDMGTLYSEIYRQFRKTVPEIRARHPELRRLILDEGREETARLLCRRRASRAGGVSHDTPEFRNAWQSDPPATRVAAGRLDCPPGRAMLGESCTVGGGR